MVLPEIKGPRSRGFWRLLACLLGLLRGTWRILAGGASMKGASSFHPVSKPCSRGVDGLELYECLSLAGVLQADLHRQLAIGFEGM